MSATDTIFALSSGAPPAAIAIIRISGPAAFDVVHGLAGRTPKPRRASLAILRAPDSGETLDQALVLLFPGPIAQRARILLNFIFMVDVPSFALSKKRYRSFLMCARQRLGNLRAELLPMAGWI